MDVQIVHVTLINQDHVNVVVINVVVARNNNVTVIKNVNVVISVNVTKIRNVVINVTVENKSND